MKFCKKTLWEASRTLVSVAAGKTPADTVIRDGKLVNVCTAEIMEGVDIAIAEGRIALVGDASHCIGEGTKVIDAEGQFLAPGFLDGHVHIESSMLSVSEYAKAVIPHGTTGICPDPHEVCNVIGMDGVRCMVEDSKQVPLKCMFMMPSCVPAVPGFEDTGSAVGPEDVAEAMKWDEMVGLGEMMNFPGVLNGEDHAHDIVGETLKAGKIVSGHYSLPETGAGLNAYISCGVRNCHESTRAEDALEKMRRGMYAQFREGSAWHDLQEVVKSITEQKVDTRFACMVSDDAHPHTLIANGHLDHLLRRVLEEGIDPITAIQMVTINVAQCFKVDDELGSIAPGKCADIVFLESLENMKVTRVLIDGDEVARDGKMVVDIPPYRYPDWAMNTMHVGKAITPDTFQVEAPAGKSEVTVRAIEVIPVKVPDREVHVTLKVKDGCLESDMEQDVLKTFVFERHHETGTVGKGFVKGFGIKKGAMASTVAHDAHNLLVVGTNDADMALAANTLIQCGGGMVAVCDGEVLGLVELPIAGLMNQKSVNEMSDMVSKLEKSWEKTGCTMHSPFMTMALIPLACIPELRLTNRGLVDCTTFEMKSLIVEE